MSSKIYLCIDLLFPTIDNFDCNTSSFSSSISNNSRNWQCILDR